MLRDEVADHYRTKGYTIRQNVKVRGQSGSVHVVDMVAQSPLGNLVIAFEDEGGFDGPEMHSVRRAARDIGATPVVAVQRIPDGLRRRAAEAGVVMLDPEAMRVAPPDPPVPDEPEQTPWPDPDARRSTGPPGAPPGKSTDPGFWRYPRGGVPPEGAPAFGWLPQEATPADATAAAAAEPATGVASVGAPQEHRAAASRPAIAPRPAAVRVPAPVVHVPAPRAAPSARTAGLPWRLWLASAAVFGAAAGGTLYAFLRIFG